MDTSPEYIAMCDCEEIQAYRMPKVRAMTDGRIHSEWDLKNGDFIWIGKNHEDTEVVVKGDTPYSPYSYNQPGNTTVEIGMVGYDEGAGFTVEKIIWLPRQDQIQEMIGGFLYSSILMEKWYDSELSSNIALNTWEQRWLHIYMHEKHSKTWDGEKWQ